MAEHEAPADAADETSLNEQDEFTDQSPDAVDALRRDLLNAIGDLRAEVARLQMDEARGRIRQWIRDNPTLAIFLATGTGIVAGRLLTKALAPSPPPPLSERVRQRAQALAEAARRQAQEAGEGVTEQAAAVRRRADATRKVAEGRAAEAGERLRRRAQDWGAAVADRAAALSSEAAGRAKELGTSIGHEADTVRSSVTDRAERAGEALKSSAQGLSETADTVRSGYKAAKMGAKVAKVAFALLVAKKSADWVRKIL